MLGYFPQTGNRGCWSLPSSARRSSSRNGSARPSTRNCSSGPPSRLELNLNGLWSRFGADNINQNYLAWGSQALGGGGTLTNATVEGDTAVAGVISSADNGTAGRGVVFDAIDRMAFAKTWYGDFDATLTAERHLARAFRHRLHPGGRRHRVAAFRRVRSAGFLPLRPAGEHAAGAIPQHRSRQTRAHMEFDFASLHHITNDDSEVYSYLDAEKFLNAGALKSLKFGLKYTDHERKTDFQATTYGGFFLPLLGHGLRRPGLHAPPTSPAASRPSDFLERHRRAGNAGQLLVRRPGARPERSCSTASTEAASPTRPRSSPSRRNVTGGFAMANLEAAASGRATSASAPCAPTRHPPATSSAAPARSERLRQFHPRHGRPELYGLSCRASTSPSISADDLVLRLAAARTMARPDYHRRVAAGDAQPGCPHRTGRRPRRRPVPREPGRRLARVVSRRRRDPLGRRCSTRTSSRSSPTGRCSRRT